MKREPTIGARRSEVDVSGRGEIISTISAPAILVGKWRPSGSPQWLVWCAYAETDFATMCSAFDKLHPSK